MKETVQTQIKRLEEFMGTVTDAAALPRDAASFMHALLLSTGAKSVVEIGTSYGYSGLWIAAALAEVDGMLHTIDKETDKLVAAQAHFKSAGVTDYVKLHHGKALDILPKLEGPFHFVLNDADKENCREYVEMLVDKLADRAIILTDNTRTHAEQLGDFVEWIRAEERFVSTDLPIGNGMELSVKWTARRSHGIFGL